MTGGCTDYRGDLAAYVLGALEPSERLALQEHLASCADCSAELAELEPLPGLMARIPLGAVTGDQLALDDSFADRMVAVVDRRRRRRWIAAAAAAVAVAGTASGLALTLGSAAPGTFRAADARTGAAAQIRLVSRTIGTEIVMEISGVPERARCTLIAVARGGGTDVAGSWQATYSGTASIEGITAIPERQLAELIVETTAGQRLLTVRMPTST